MAVQVTYPILQSRPKYIFTACLVMFIVANVILDYLATLFQNSAFYLSESLLFSSYWVLFLPVLALLLKLTRKTERTVFKLALMVLVITFHLLLYPALVWVISKGFYTHTYSYWQTFNFGLSAYFINTVIIYGFLLAVFLFRNKTIPQKIEEKNETKSCIDSILITDGNYKKSVIAVNEILYFSANTPYVNIHLLSKKHLHTETLKSLETQLNSNQFVRIHRSYIVNIDKISSLQSRQNGDYDITLSDGTVLRMSRNYAKHFKFKLSERHQVTVK